MNWFWDFLWIGLPYLSLGIFVTGHVWRYRRDKFGWTSRSSQLLESRWLAWGSNLFHYGALAAIGGHVVGILIPNWITADLGVTEFEYHLVSVGAGTLAGIPCMAGLIILIARRIAFARIRAVTSMVDVAVYTLLFLEILLGLGQTEGVNLFGGGYDYRVTEAIWFRGIFTLNPTPALIEQTPLVYQVHATLAWFIYMLWPFSRLVHVWSYPLQYLGRPYILYRARYATARR